MIRHTDAQELLSTARDVLLKTLLPQLPPASVYEARMVASAMAMVTRELSLGSEIAHQHQQAIASFYQLCELMPEHADEASLAQDIRNGRIDVVHEEALLTLLESLTRGKLRINNPKRLNSA